MPCVEVFHLHEFGVVQLYQILSNYIFTGGTRCVGYLYTRSRHSEPPRTFSNNVSAEKARCVEVFHMSSG